MEFSDDELDRYSRQLILREFGGLGQQRMKAARVAMVGAGGIGCAVIPGLVGAGLGQLTIIDPDRVSLSNLARQPLYKSAQVGMEKARIASDLVLAANPHVEVKAHVAKVTADNAADLLSGHDLIIDGTDNFTSRLIISDACVELGLPLLSAAAEMWQGQIALFGAQPCYRCMVGDAFDNDDCDTCAERGILGATVGTTGQFAALMAIRALTGMGAEPGKLHVFDGQSLQWKSHQIPADPNCRACGAEAISS